MTHPSQTPVADDDESPKGFAQIPRWLQRDQTITAAAKLVYLALASRADKYGSCHPSHKLLAVEASCSVPTVKRALAELLELGVVTWETRIRPGDNGRTSNIYTVTVGARRSTSAEAPLAQSEPAPQITESYPLAQGELGPSSHRANKNESQKNETQKNERDLEGIDDDGTALILAASIDQVHTVDDAFAELWKLWPRGEGKKPALSKFRTAAKRMPPAEIVAGAKAWLDARPHVHPTFVPHLATWLHQERWLDDPPPAAAAAPSRHPAVQHGLDLVAHFEALEGPHEPHADRQALDARIDDRPRPADH